MEKRRGPDPKYKLPTDQLECCRVKDPSVFAPYYVIFKWYKIQNILIDLKSNVRKQGVEYHNRYSLPKRLFEESYGRRVDTHYRYVENMKGTGSKSKMKKKLCVDETLV